MAAPIDLHEVAERELEERSRYPWRIKACASTSCQSAGAGPAIAAIEAEVATTGLASEVRVVSTGCMGLCSQGPLVRVLRRGGEEVMYHSVDAEVGPEIVRSHTAKGESLEANVLDKDMPFFARQQRIVLANAGIIDPDRLESAVAHGAYRALHKALTTMTPTQVVDEIKASGLRGRGGAGYPAGTKWALLASAESDQKYVIANGDEGDPGAYMDRTVMEDDPHRVIEGLALAAYATGANHGYIYVRAEYPKAVERLDRAIRSARRSRLLGRKVLETNFDFEVEIRIGAGAFVCGEETALIASIEGRRGTALPDPEGVIRETFDDQQRGDAGQRPGHHLPRSRLVRRHRHGKELGHQGLRSGRGSHQHRSHRGAHGDHPEGDRRGHGRQRARREGLQGCPDRRAVRWVYPQRVSRHPGGLREPPRTRLHHGFGRPHRDG